MALLETFTSSVNELASVIGYTAIIVCLVYGVAKIMHGFLSRGS